MTSLLPPPLVEKLALTADQKTKLDSLGADFFGQGLGDIRIPGGGH